MKITLRIARILFSIVSIAAMTVVSVMLFCSGILAALDACGFIDLDDETPYVETKREPMQYSVFKEPETIRIGYTLVDISEPDTDTQAEMQEYQENEEQDNYEALLQEGYISDDIPLSYDLQMTARDAASRFDVPYALVIAMIWKESSFCETAYNAECYGLMQVASINFHWICVDLKDIGIEDIAFDPEDNIYAGTYMISDLIHRYGDYNLALMAYNCGEAGAARLWDQGYYSSGYSRSIIDYMDDLLEQGIAKEMVLDGTFS